MTYPIPADSPGQVKIHVSGKPVAWARAGSHVVNGKLATFVQPHSREQREKRRPKPTTADHVGAFGGVSRPVVFAPSVEGRGKDGL